MGGGSNGRTRASFCSSWRQIFYKDQSSDCLYYGCTTPNFVGAVPDLTRGRVFPFAVIGDQSLAETNLFFVCNFLELTRPCNKPNLVVQTPIAVHAHCINQFIVYVTSHQCAVLVSTRYHHYMLSANGCCWWIAFFLTILSSVVTQIPCASFMPWLPA